MSDRGQMERRLPLYFINLQRHCSTGCILLLCCFVAACTGYIDDASPEKNYTLYAARNIDSQQSHEKFRAHCAQQLEILKNSNAKEVRQLRKQLDKYRDLPEPEQLAEVNNAINDSVHYLPHYAHRPEPSGWGDIECVMDVGGDCADYAQVKYLALRYLGWPTERLQIVVGWSWHNQQKILHAMLLATQTNQSQLLLDNLDPMPKPPLYASDFDPLYAFNEDQSFVFDARRSSSAPPATSAGEGSR